MALKHAIAGISALSFVYVAAVPSVSQAADLVYANGYAKTHVQVGVLADEWIEKINKATDGRVKIRHVAGGALLKPEKMLEGVAGQVADAGSMVASFFPGQLPISATLASTVDLDIGNKLDMRGVAAITMKLLEEFDAFNDEYAKQGVTPVLWVPTPSYGIISKEPITSLADLKGKKIRIFGNNLPKLLAAAGAVPQPVAFGEIYTSLQTGLLDGAMTDPPAMVMGKFGEIAKHVMVMGPGDGALTALAPVVYFFNNDSFDKLSKADQEAIKKVSRDMTLTACDTMVETQNKALGQLKHMGVTIHHLPAADAAQLAQQAPNFYDLAAANLNDRGYPGTAIVKRYQELAADYISGAWKPWN